MQGSSVQRILSMDEKDQIAYRFFQNMRLQEQCSPLVITTSSRNNDITLFAYNAAENDFSYSNIPDYAENRSLIFTPPSEPFSIPRFEETPGYIHEISQVDIRRKYRDDLYQLNLHAMNKLQAWLQFHIDHSTRKIDYRYRPRVLVPKHLFDTNASPNEFAQIYHLNVLLSPPSQQRIEIQCIIMNAFDLSVNTSSGELKRLSCRLPGDMLSVDMNRVIQRVMELQ